MEARPHLSIGEVLALLQPEFPDVTISKIRFLESQGLLDPERTPSGYRKFYDDDLARLRWILTQQRDHFLPLKVIKERLGEGGSAEDEAMGDDDQPASGGPAGSEGTGGATTTPTAGDRAALADALARRAAARSEEQPASPSPVPRVLDSGPSDASFTAPELAAAAGISERDVERLTSFGLLEGRTIGRETIFDGDALAVARLAGGFLERGLEPRHLRMFKVAAEREAGVYQQLVIPLTRQRNPEARTRAEHRLGELADLGHQLRSVLLRRAVRDLFGR